jgi:hypothetical protein
MSSWRMPDLGNPTERYPPDLWSAKGGVRTTIGKLFEGQLYC